MDRELRDHDFWTELMTGERPDRSQENEGIEITTTEEEALQKSLLWQG